MGACKEAIYNTIERDLKKVYRAEEGWRLEQGNGDDSPAYVLVRRRPGKMERILVNVRMAASVGAADFEYVKAMAARSAAQGLPVSRNLLVVPQNVAVPADTADVDLFYLNTYAVRNGAVIWSRSNLWTAEGKPVLEKA
ncbi:hypothetical protein [uncultured Methanofollis sp.]|uniref:hypothetical protein n=1 Tax=uncultured Methanofollis sp. TaxID=262500 RepID=UPI00262DECB0|nr:hypothetical protein [uncultured Methanofollis sp.]